MNTRMQNLMAALPADCDAALVSTDENRFYFLGLDTGDAGTLLLTDRGFREPAQLFSNRAVEKLFQEFESVKFFLSRDSLREVIVRR